MTERDLRKLSRIELLELLVEQGKETEALREQVRTLQEELSNRQMDIMESGNIAEAALKLNNVFEAAQNAAQQYVDNVKSLSERQEAICSEIEQRTKEKCDALYKETKRKCYQMEIDAQEGIDGKWKELSERIAQIYNKQK